MSTFKVYYQQTSEGRSFRITPESDEFLFMSNPINEEGEKKRLRAELALGGVSVELVELKPKEAPKATPKAKPDTKKPAAKKKTKD